MSLIRYLPHFHSFFFNDTATTEIYTLSLHDALPILTLRDRKRALERPLTLGSKRAGHAPGRPVRRTGYGVVGVARVRIRLESTVHGIEQRPAIVLGQGRQRTDQRLRVLAHLVFHER